MTAALVITYAVGWFVTAVAYTYANHDAAPTDTPPAGVGLIVGTLWPAIWVLFILVGLVELGVYLLRKALAQPEDGAR